MFKTMLLFDFEQTEIERMLDWSAHNIYAKTNSRSVLGSMTDMAFHIEYYIHAYGGLTHADFADIHRRINRMPFKAIGSKYPVDRLKDLLSGQVGD